MGEIKYNNNQKDIKLKECQKLVILTLPPFSLIIEIK